MPILPANFVFFPNPNTDSSNLAMGSSQTLHTKRFIQGYHIWDGFREAKSEMQMIKKAAACTITLVHMTIISKLVLTSLRSKKTGGTNHHHLLYSHLLHDYREVKMAHTKHLDLQSLHQRMRHESHLLKSKLTLLQLLLFSLTKPSSLHINFVIFPLRLHLWPQVADNTTNHL